MPEGSAFDLCVDLYGECRCVIAGRPACDAMQALVDNDLDADDERERMANETADHEF